MLNAPKVLALNVDAKEQKQKQKQKKKKKKKKKKKRNVALKLYFFISSLFLCVVYTSCR